MRGAVLYLAGALLLGVLRAAAQPFGIAYWDVDRLYDTLPARFYDDSDYTPGGRLRWDTERYRRKIDCTAAVLDSLALPVVALFGVENETVVRDLARRCRNDYTYLHRTLNRRDGLDFALFYYGDRFFPHYVEPGNSYLYVEGTCAPRYGVRDTLGLLLCRDERMARILPRMLRRERPGVRLVLLGRFAASEAQQPGLRELTARAEGAGRGNRFRRGRWEMRDRIAADTALRHEACDVYIRRWLLDPHTGRPLPTYDQRAYRGGSSAYLPVFAYLSAP